MKTAKDQKTPHSFNRMMTCTPVEREEKHNEIIVNLLFKACFNNEI